MSFKAVIFDMDGVLINSEHLWREAMITGFSEAGMNLTEEDCRKTMGMRFREVIALWLDHFKITDKPVNLIEERVIEILAKMINERGRFIEGIPGIISLCKEKKIKLGIATSSSEFLMKTVMKKLDLMGSIDVAVSAEHLRYGKPHPEVFLRCADQLHVLPPQCLVIEDSLNGVIAAKAAQMTVVAVPDDDHSAYRQFALADYKFDKMPQVLDLFKRLFADYSPV